LNSVLEQSKAWLEQGNLRQLVLVVTDAISKEVMERWTFDIETSKEAKSGAAFLERPEKEITSEIQAIMRQITASVTFLPLLETRCTIDILCYTNPIDAVPEEWEDTDARVIANPEIVSLRGFKTNVHGVKTMVAYKQTSDEVL
jgi:mitotic spindle assembly checkpoint protein MAD2